MARLAIVHTLSWVADSSNVRLRLKASLDEVGNDLSLLEEELRIEDARMGHLDVHRRPHYRPVERLAILELKAARGC